MKSPEEIRREMDSAKIVAFPPEEKRGKPAKAPRELSTVWADDIVLELDTGGLVDGLLGTTGLTVLYGESGAGKTFVALDLACHVAAGLPWHGLEVEQGVVVYVAAESPESVKRRLWAWKRHHGVERLPVLVVQSAVDLLNGDAETLAGLLEKLKAEHGRIALVVVDTLARAMTGNENAPDDMGRFVAACGRLRETGETHVMVVHHSGKDAARGARGHSSLRAATDVELEVTNGESGGAVRVTKNRDEAGGANYGFKLEQVELGANAKGRVVTTCVAVACDPPDRATAAERRPLGGNEKIVFEALAAAIVDHGVPAPAAVDVPPMVRVAPVARWRDAAMRYLPQPEAKRKGEAFNRAQASLVGSGRVRHVDGYAWIGGGRTGRTGSHEASCDRHATTAAGSHGSRVSLDTRPCDRATAGQDCDVLVDLIPTADCEEGTDNAAPSPGTAVDTGDPRRWSPVEERREVFRDTIGHLATIVFSDSESSPVVKQVKLHLIETDPTGYAGEAGFRLVYRERTRKGRWRRNQVIIERRMPSPLAVIQGEVGDIQLPPMSRGRVMFDDAAVYRAVWGEVAQRVRVEAADRRLLIDCIDEAVAHEAEEIPRRVAANRARDAAWREANGCEESLP